jgi:hypothetical protein
MICVSFISVRLEFPLNICWYCASADDVRFKVGAKEGMVVGMLVGRFTGSRVGSLVDGVVGLFEGVMDGKSDGTEVGRKEAVGASVLIVGLLVG